MIYAQILQGIVKNTIVVDEDTPMDLFAQNFDYFIRIDNLTPMPGISWSYDGAQFSAPAQGYEEDDI